MSIVGRKKVRCHHGILKTVNIHSGEHGGRFYMKRRHGGGVIRKYIK
jgi:hypothetical protein